MTPPVALLGMVSPQEDARDLIQRALRRDAQAVEELVARLMPIVRARVFWALKRSQKSVEPAAVDDMVQEIWVSLFVDRGRRLLAYDPARGASLEHFVGVLAEREVAVLLRSSRAQKRGGHLRAVELAKAAEVPARDGGPAEEAEAKQLASRLGEHLGAQLPEVGRLVLRYAFQDGVAPPSVARILGVEVQVVYNWQHKIRRLAREFLDAVQR